MASDSLADLQAEVHSISDRLDGLRDTLAKFDTLILEFTRLRAESLKQTDDISSAVELALERLGDISTQSRPCPPEDSFRPHSPAPTSIPDVHQPLDDDDRTSNTSQSPPPPMRLTRNKVITRSCHPSRSAEKSSHQPDFRHSPISTPLSSREHSNMKDDRETANSPATLTQLRRSGRSLTFTGRSDEHSPIQATGIKPQASNRTGEPEPKRQKTDQPSGKGGRVVLYSQEEDDIILATLQTHRSKTITNRQLFDIVSAQLKKKGFNRTRGAIQVRWYSKLLKESSIRLNEDPGQTAPFDEEREEPRRQSGPPQSTTDSGYTKLVQTWNSTLSRRLMNLRMGSSSANCSKSRSSREALREAAGKHFILTGTWTGASNDIIDVSWSPDGVNYIAGSATQQGEYNRPNNLLLGSMAHNRLISLPNHRHRRAGDDSSLADPWIYETVSTVRWSSHGTGRHDLFMSAGFDGTVKQWDFSSVEGTASCDLSYRHRDSVITLDLSVPTLGLFATGTTSIHNSLRWYSIGDPVPNSIDLSTRRARSITDSIMCLRFGSSSQNMNYLLAGFASHTVHQERGPSTSGFLGLWRFDESQITPINVSPNTQQVFDVAWSLSNDKFLAGQSRRRRALNAARSVVRLYSTKQEQMLLEVDCQAPDINEVGFCPFDETIVTASCTDDVTYLWDTRRPDQVLHTLRHNRDKHDYVQKEDDTGVRVLQWGRYQGELYTGGGDGKLLQWDVRRNPDDVFVDTILDCGVEQMSGSLSPSMNEFLIGDAAGSIHLLERSPSLSDEPPIQLELFDETMVTSLNYNDTSQHKEGDQGREAARQLIESGIIEMHPDFGPVQGPRYKPKSKHPRSKQVKNPEIEQTKRWIFKFTQNRKRNHEVAFNNGLNPREMRPQGAWAGSTDASTEDDESENYFPPAWAVDANIESYRSET